jgi:MFS family permease
MTAGFLDRLSSGRRTLPSAFWFLWLGTLVNRLGGFAVPFLMLYLTSSLRYEPAQAAAIVSTLGLGSFLAQLTGGELADRLGRRPVMLLSFFVTPLALLAVGLAHDIRVLVPATFALGFFTDLYRPAMSAAIIDLVPEGLRTRAFGYVYWAINLGAAVGPIAAGVLANVDYFLLFAIDALTTAVFGVIVFLRVPESQPREVAGTARTRNTGARLGLALRDTTFAIFVALFVLVGLIYSQHQVTLPIDMVAKGLLPSDFGLAIAVNGALIVLFTIPITRLAERWPRFPTIAAHAVLLGLGFGLTGFADSLPFYALTVAIWTMGEVIGAAVAPAIVAEMSPPALRGLYQGIWGSSWGLAFFLGPALGGFLYQELGSIGFWSIAFVLGGGISVSYLALSRFARRRAALASPS